MTDLLTDLKTAYEKLGYEVESLETGLYYYDKPQSEFSGSLGKYRGCVPSQEPVVTPDLCKEMKDWLKKEGYYLQIGLPTGDRPAFVTCFDSKGNEYRTQEPTEEEAILAAFLEVTKEKSE